ncbi:MAG TPA: M20/M25/M40 family metallo-hydrolase [Candidatus Limiplasma sp.]|nr:M20/M25/M40 family metallo-hydrolase [Candidatus Limiplasma sp.]HPS80797.1 M20/M25/M40 family metallo-hydrolase [Candidatus Limiplasma sp.]
MEELIRKLTAAYGPSGREGEVADLIESLLKGKVDSIRRDALGNLICEKKGTAKDGRRIMFSAHMDQIGLIVTHAEKEGYLRVSNVGGIFIANSRMRHVRFQNGVHGVLVEQPLKPGETSSMRTYYIDIGANSADEALRKVQLGDVAIYAEECFTLGERRLAAPAMDDRCACALLVSLMQALPPCKDTVIAVFSTQEEVGCRGGKTAAYSVEPDVGIALDVTLCGDQPEDRKLAINLGEGPAVKIMDMLSISNPELVQALLAAAKRAKIPCQREVLPFGGTDAGAMQLTRGGMPVCTLSIPSRNVHSSCEIVDLNDLENAQKLLLAYLKG